jgi:predicted lipoprotein with Yx(FWY)xxD motif
MDTIAHPANRHCANAVFRCVRQSNRQPELHLKGKQMNNRLTSRRASLALKVGLPLAAAGVFAAACSSSGAAPGSAPSTSSGTSAAGGNSSTSTVDVRTSNGKTFLADGSGRSLYLWVPDTTTMSMCSGACATYWPPLTTNGAPTAGPGVTATDLGTTSRSDGTEQVTYAGHPLYYFAGDRGAGQTSGQGVNEFGALWWLVAPSGQKITTSDSAAPSMNSGYNGGY